MFCVFSFGGLFFVLLRLLVFGFCFVLRFFK